MVLKGHWMSLVKISGLFCESPMIPMQLSAQLVEDMLSHGSRSSFPNSSGWM